MLDIVNLALDFNYADFLLMQIIIFVIHYGWIIIVDFAGGFCHNDDSLIKNFQNDKIVYLRNYIFNICPENYKAILWRKYG